MFASPPTIHTYIHGILKKLIKTRQFEDKRKAPKKGGKGEGGREERGGAEEGGLERSGAGR